MKAKRWKLKAEKSLGKDVLIQGGMQRAGW
jgi:hypothetical protein